MPLLRALPARVSCCVSTRLKLRRGTGGGEVRPLQVLALQALQVLRCCTLQALRCCARSVGAAGATRCVINVHNQRCGDFESPEVMKSICGILKSI